MAKTNKIQIRVIRPLWGKFNLPYAVGHSPKIETKLANEIIKSGHAITEEEAKKMDELANEEEKENEE